MYNPQPYRLSLFKRPRVLIVGCGDVGLRVAKLLRGNCRLMALTSQNERVPALRAQGIVPLVGNLDQPASLARLAGLAPYVVHMAPPPNTGGTDTRTAHILSALGRRGSTAASTVPTRSVPKHWWRHGPCPMAQCWGHGYFPTCRMPPTRANLPCCLISQDGRWSAQPDPHKGRYPPLSMSRWLCMRPWVG